MQQSYTHFYVPITTNANAVVWVFLEEDPTVRNGDPTAGNIQLKIMSNLRCDIWKPLRMVIKGMRSARNGGGDGNGAVYGWHRS